MGDSAVDNVMAAGAAFPLMELFHSHSECLEEILSFCDASTLCALDLSASDFQEYTDRSFEKLAMKRFGMKASVPGEAGKRTWSKGLALVAPKKHHLITLTQPAEYVFEPNRDGLSFANIATHPSSSVIIYDGDNFCGGNFEELTGKNPVYCRDAQTLASRPPLSNPWIIHCIAVCGPGGCDIIVTANPRAVVARLGQRLHEISLADYDHSDSTGNGIEMIGDEHYLVILQYDIMYLFQPTPWGSKLLSFVTSVKVDKGEGLPCGRVLTRACPQLPGVFGFFPSNEKISVWKVRTQVGNEEPALELTRLFSCNTNVTFGAMAIGERYFAGSIDSKSDRDDRNHEVFNFETNELVHVLSETDLPDDVSACYKGSYLEFVGDLLVTTSWLPSMLCVWDARAGTLLRRYNGEGSTGLIAPPPPDHGRPWERFTKVVHMSRIYQSGGHLSFLTIDGASQKLWSFPCDWRGETLVGNLGRRESVLKTTRNTFDFEQDPAAFGAVGRV